MVKLKWIVNMFASQQTPEDRILRLYRDWRYGPSNRGYLYDKLQQMVRRNQYHLMKLVFSGKPTEDELHELIFIGGHGGSCARKDNVNWVPFVSIIRARQKELPESIQSTLDWYLRTHGW